MFPHKSAGLMGGVRKALFISGVQHSYQSPQTIGAMGGQVGDLIMSVFPNFATFRIGGSNTGIIFDGGFFGYKFLTSGDLANYFDCSFSSTYVTGYTHILRGPTSFAKIATYNSSSHPGNATPTLTKASNHQGLVGVSYNGGSPDTNFSTPSGATALGYGYDPFGAGASGYTYIAERLQDPPAANGINLSMTGGSGSVQNTFWELRG